jgi:hypothetical protein
VRMSDNLAILTCRFSRNSGSLKPLETSGPVQTCNGINLPFIIKELHNDSCLEMVVQHLRRLAVDFSRGSPQPCGHEGVVKE